MAHILFVSQKYKVYFTFPTLHYECGHKPLNICTRFLKTKERKYIQIKILPALYQAFVVFVTQFVCGMSALDVCF